MIGGGNGGVNRRYHVLEISTSSSQPNGDGEANHDAAQRAPGRRIARRGQMRGARHGPASSNITNKISRARRQTTRTRHRNEALGAQGATWKHHHRERWGMAGEWRNKSWASGSPSDGGQQTLRHPGRLKSSINKQGGGQKCGGGGDNGDGQPAS